MATYAELYSLIDDAGFQQRVKFALYVQASGMQGQASSKNRNWASAVLKGQLRTDFRLIMVRVLSHPTGVLKGAAMTDSELQDLVAGLTPFFVETELGNASQST